MIIHYFYVGLRIKTIFNILLFFCFSTISLGQNYADKSFFLIDSLELDQLSECDIALLDSALNIYHRANHDTSKIIALNIICEEMMSDKWSYYQDYQYQMILNIAKKNSTLEKWSKLHLANALNNFAYLSSYRYGDIEKALDYLLESVKIQQDIKDYKGLATSYSNIGFIYNILGKIKEALDYHFKSLNIRDKLSDYDKMAFCYNNIGSVYYTISNYDLALKYYYKAQKIRENKDDQKGIANSYSRIGKIHHKKGDLRLALKHFNKALELQDTIGYKLGSVTTLINLGKVNISLNEIDSATTYFFKAIEISDEIQYKQGTASSHYGLAQIYFKKNEIEQSRLLAEAAHNMFKELKNVSEIVNSTKLLSEIYEKQNNIPKAYKFHKLHLSLKDSLTTTENQNAIIGKEFKYEYEKKELLHKVEREKLRNVEKLKRERERSIFFGIAIILIIILGGLTRIRHLHNLREREKLLHEIVLLKQKGISRVIAGVEKSTEFTLNKEKIESAINKGLNVSDWKILTTIFDDPFISNKEIAEKVSLSIEGTSSSLRKMYRLFELKEAKNKKLALTIEATRISSETA
jgi:tetratricopeptide (TPR) repeat protein